MSPSTGLTQEARALYVTLLEHGGSARRGELTAPEAGAAYEGPTTDSVDTLIALHLVQWNKETDVLAVVNPQVAAAAVGAVRAEEIRRLHITSEQARSSIEDLQGVFDSTCGNSLKEVLIESVTDLRLVRSLLSHAASCCVKEVLTTQPDALAESFLDDSRSRDLALLERGVRVRTVYPHTVLSHPAVQQYFKVMQEAGSEIRTAPGITERLVIFDREVAFLGDSRTSEQGAVVIREPAVVDYLYRSLEQTWRLAKPFVYTRVGYGQTVDDIKSSIVQFMAAGAKDEVVARRMNMSIRTCRRHIAELVSELGAESRFQAGALAAAQGLITSDPSDPT